MIPDDPTLLQLLVDRGLVSRGTRLEPLIGNVDRHPARARRHWFALQPGGPRLKLMAAPTLADVRERATAFAAAAPALAAREVFFLSEAGLDIWAIAAIEGDSAETLDRDAASAARLLVGLDALDRVLDQTRISASPATFDEEWRPWCRAVAALPTWTEPEQRFLVDSALPALRTRLAPGCAFRRWTNGDCISGNLCLRPAAPPALFDAEYASLTHFHTEDRVRFMRISPIAHRHPALFEGWWEPVDPGWEVHFQLRQLVLEHQENSAAYNRRETPARRAAVRFFGEPWMGTFPPTWEGPQAPPPQFPVGEVVQLFWRASHEPFSERRSRQVRVRAGMRQLAGFHLPGADIAAWRLDPAGTRRPVVVHSLLGVAPDASTGGAVPVPFSVEGAGRSAVADGVRLDPDGPDPQLHFTLPTGTIGLVAELSCI